MAKPEAVSHIVYLRPRLGLERDHDFADALDVLFGYESDLTPRVSEVKDRILALNCKTLESGADE